MDIVFCDGEIQLFQNFRFISFVANHYFVPSEDRTFLEIDLSEIRNISHFPKYYLIHAERKNGMNFTVTINRIYYFGKSIVFVDFTFGDIIFSENKTFLLEKYFFAPTFKKNFRYRVISEINSFLESKNLKKFEFFGEYYSRQIWKKEELLLHLNFLDIIIFGESHGARGVSYAISEAALSDIPAFIIKLLARIMWKEYFPYYFNKSKANSFRDSERVLPRLLEKAQILNSIPENDKRVKYLSFILRKIVK